MTSPIFSPIDQWVPVVFVADANTPVDVAQYTGNRYLMDPLMLDQVGSGPQNAGRIRGVRGYFLVDPAPDGSRQWLMTSPVPPALVAAFNALPGGSGWVDPAARGVYLQVGLMLLEQYGAPGPDVLTALQRLYSAAVTNFTAVPPGG